MQISNYNNIADVAFDDDDEILIGFVRAMAQRQARLDHAGALQ